MTDLIDRWLEVRALGYTTYAAAAGRLGDIKPATLERAINRARKAGDPRVPTRLRDTVTPSYDQLSHHPSMAVAVHYSVDERRRAVRYTASRARDAHDLAELLDALGLKPGEGKP